MADDRISGKSDQAQGCAAQRQFPAPDRASMLRAQRAGRGGMMAVADRAAASHTKTRLNRQQILGFWSAWFGWLLDGMDSVIYALVLAPALTELLPRSG